MPDQLSLFPQLRYWRAETDNGCRLWACPCCGGRMVGQPLHWHQFNAYRYCPYCGERLYTRPGDLSPEDERNEEDT